MQRWPNAQWQIVQLQSLCAHSSHWSNFKVGDLHVHLDTYTHICYCSHNGWLKFIHWRLNMILLQLINQTSKWGNCWTESLWRHINNNSYLCIYCTVCLLFVKWPHLFISVAVISSNCKICSPAAQTRSSCHFGVKTGWNFWNPTGTFSTIK